MLTDEQISKNKEKFIQLLKTIDREGSDIDGLIKKLEHSDFFVAPASTQYHCSFKGGLCYHSLNVYHQLMQLIEIEYPKEKVIIPNDDPDKEPKIEYKDTCPYSAESLIIISLLHDMSKMNFYEIAERNVKDEKGNWVKVPFIKTRDAKDRFLYSTHGVNSEYMVGTFIPLTLEESVAIINHMGGQEPGAPNMDSGLSQIFNRYPLAILLHSADMLATFFTERMV